MIQDHRSFVPNRDLQENPWDAVDSEGPVHMNRPHPELWDTHMNSSESESDSDGLGISSLHDAAVGQNNRGGDTGDGSGDVLGTSSGLQEAAGSFGISSLEDAAVGQDIRGGDTADGSGHVPVSEGEPSHRPREGRDGSPVPVSEGKPSQDWRSRPREGRDVHTSEVEHPKLKRYSSMDEYDKAILHEGKPLDRQQWRHNTLQTQEQLPQSALTSNILLRALALDDLEMWMKGPNTSCKETIKLQVHGPESQLYLMANCPQCSTKVY